MSSNEQWIPFFVHTDAPLLFLPAPHPWWYLPSAELQKAEISRSFLLRKEHHHLSSCQHYPSSTFLLVCEVAAWRTKCPLPTVHASVWWEMCTHWQVQSQYANCWAQREQVRQFPSGSPGFLAHNKAGQSCVIVIKYLALAYLSFSLFISRTGMRIVSITKGHRLNRLAFLGQYYIRGYNKMPLLFKQLREKKRQESSLFYASQLVPTGPQLNKVKLWIKLNLNQ